MINPAQINPLRLKNQYGKSLFESYVFIKPAGSVGFWRIKKIPGPVDSIGALKMYILEKRILGT